MAEEEKKKNDALFWVAVIPLLLTSALYVCMGAYACFSMEGLVLVPVLINHAVLLLATLTALLLTIPKLEFGRKTFIMFTKRHWGYAFTGVWFLASAVFLFTDRTFVDLIEKNKNSKEKALFIVIIVAAAVNGALMMVSLPLAYKNWPEDKPEEKPAPESENDAGDGGTAG